MAKSFDWDGRIGRRIRLRDLHILFAVVQHGSMAKAGAHLGMSQSAVSQAIAALEHALAVPVLDRTPRGVELTIYGTALMRRGQAAFDELRSGVKDIEFLADPEVGEVRIACTESMAAETEENGSAPLMGIALPSGSITNDPGVPETPAAPPAWA